jgi:hypothetical protein
MGHVTVIVGVSRCGRRVFRRQWIVVRPPGCVTIHYLRAGGLWSGGCRGGGLPALPDAARGLRRAAPGHQRRKYPRTKIGTGVWRFRRLETLLANSFRRDWFATIDNLPHLRRLPEVGNWPTASPRTSIRGEPGRKMATQVRRASGRGQCDSRERTSRPLHDRLIEMLASVLPSTAGVSGLGSNG